MTLIVCFNITISGQNTPLGQEKLDALKAYQNKKKDTTYVKLLNTVGFRYRYIELDSMKSMSERALKLSQNLNYLDGQAIALLNLGDYYADIGETLKCISYYQKALEISEKSNSLKTLQLIYSAFASFHYHSGNHTEALENYLKAKDIAIYKGDTKSIVSINHNISLLYTSQKDFEQALKVLIDAKSFEKDIDDKYLFAITAANLSSAYLSLKNYDSSLKYLDECIPIFKEYNRIDWLAYVLQIKGELYLEKENYKKAFFHLKEAETIYDTITDPVQEANLNNKLALAYFKTGKKELAIKKALNAYEISKKLKFIDIEISSAQTLYKIKKQSGNYKSAMEYLEVYQKLSDSLSRSENQQSLKFFKTNMVFENEKEMLKIESEKELAQQKTYFYATICIFLILLAMALPLYLKHKKLGVLYGQLENKNKKLIQRELELKKILNTKNRLFSVISHDLRGPIGGLQMLLELLGLGDIKKEEFFNVLPSLKKNVDSVLFTLNNLLQWGKSQLEGENIKSSHFLLHNLIENNHNLLLDIINKKDIKIKNEIDNDLLIYADENHIDIIIRNLISNAIKFTPKGGNIKIKCINDKKNYYTILVKDNGVGMSKDTLENIFKDDHVTTKPGTENEKGTGLGLSLCKEMIEKNKGKIWVESSLEIGSSFYFTLPKVAENKRKAC